MAGIPDVLLGVLRKGDYEESLEAIRDMLGIELQGTYCDHCHREGPRDAKETAALTLRLVDVLGKLDALSAPEVPDVQPAEVSNILSIQQRSKRRTGAGTQSTDAPTSVAKRQYGRRAGGGRKPAGG